MEVSALHQTLKSLCVNSDWNYAVFWKLNSRARMMLTCEDAYYDQNGHHSTVDNLPNAQDLLGLAVANMYYSSYALGEGLVGQVAVTDKHLWISGDQLVNDPHFSIKDYDTWKTQFAAGIRTIAFVGVVPHGVVQLGSINNILEDLKTVNHIREIFLAVQTSVSYGFNNSYANVGKSEIDTMNTLNPSFNFPAGCELYEALGPSFYNQTENHNFPTVNEIPTSSSYLTPISESGNLLEAVVGNVSRSDSEFSDSVKWVETRFSDMQTSVSGSGSACYSFENSLGFSSASRSQCSESVERSRETVSVPKKRAKPGESSRPRPRDRQLIQDRIKELRELVPNGSKCSIDSLLERTIKHMLFMQSVTTHADKIDKYAESKLLGTETSIRGTSSHEHGSSWAMEVGDNMKVCPVTVENIGNGGQMLVEMICEEGVHFLEIADAIRSLGLAILKGVTEPIDDKTRMCFVVEGQNNRNVHRMDILWLLVKILQSKEKT